MGQQGQEKKALLSLPLPHPVGLGDVQTPQDQVEHHRVEPALAVEEVERQGGE